jgi:minor tail protein Z (GPZ)
MAQQRVGITVNAEAFVNSLQGLQKPKLDQAVALALVDTAKTAISKAGSLIARRTGLKSAVVKERIFYDRVDVGDYQVVVRSSRRAIPLIEFPVSQTRSGVSTGAWGKRQTIAHAFIATMPRSGHTGVFRRTGKFGRRGKPYLERIKELWGPTIAGTFATPEVQATISAAMLARLQSALARRMASAARRR